MRGTQLGAAAPGIRAKIRPTARTLILRRVMANNGQRPATVHLNETGSVHRLGLRLRDAPEENAPGVMRSARLLFSERLIHIGRSLRADSGSIPKGCSRHIQSDETTPRLTLQPSPCVS